MTKKNCNIPVTDSRKQSKKQVKSNKQRAAYEIIGMQPTFAKTSKRNDPKLEHISSQKSIKTRKMNKIFKDSFKD